MLKYALIISLTLLISCNQNPYISGEADKSINISLHRFEQELNLLNKENIGNDKYLLNDKYKEFFSIYNEGVVRLGNYQSSGFDERMLHLLKDSIYKEVCDTVALAFLDLTSEEKALSKAFQNYNLLFPERQIPQCYTHISGFNTPIVVGDSILSISLENYLGAEHVFYKKLGTYTYLLSRKERENITIDAMKGWLVSEFPGKIKKNNLLNNIINEGKLLFVQQLIMPTIAPHLMIGITPEQYVWCDKNENSVWRFMIEKKHLFSTEQTTIAKYLQNGPFFNFYGQGSSPLIGKYIGWHIVNSYMTNNKDITIDDLLNNTNGQEILASSGYKP